jgi:hypothetical protein
MVASLAWMVFAGVAFWKPLPVIDTVFAMREEETCGGPDKFIPFDKTSEDRRMACGRLLRAKVESEVGLASARQIVSWLLWVILLPVVLPVAAFLGTVVFEWIREGYGSKSASEP